MSFRGRRGRRTEPTLAGDAIVSALENLGLGDQAKILRIARVWGECVGEPLASRARPHGFSRGVLVLKVASAAWQNELSFMKQQLVDKLNLALKAKLIADIRVISGSFHPLHQQPKAPPVPLPEDIATAQGIAAAIADPETRSAFANLMTRDLGARRKKP